MMVYLEEFTLPDGRAEDEFILSGHEKLECGCYNVNDSYPFKIFVKKSLSEIRFDPITIFCGSNGSGKSTLLQVIAKRLGVSHSGTSPVGALMDEYVGLCREKISPRIGRIPDGSRLLRSDDVFDLLLDSRSVNRSINEEREELFKEYKRVKDTKYADSPFISFDQLDELKHRNEVLRSTRSAYTERRLVKSVLAGSNGESAYKYFTDKIEEGALYLLDEPENSLSPTLTVKLMEHLENAVRFFGCQLIVATHSPFLLGLRGARIYDLDSTPVTVREYGELECVKVYTDFFKKRIKRDTGMD